MYRLTFTDPEGDDHAQVYSTRQEAIDAIKMILGHVMALEYNSIYIPKSIVDNDQLFFDLASHNTEMTWQIKEL